MTAELSLKTTGTPEPLSLGTTASVQPVAELHRKMNAPNGYIMKDEAAYVLGCRKRTIDNLMKRRAIPFYKFGRRVLFKHEEIIDSVKLGRVPSRTVTPPDMNTADDGVASAAWESVIHGLMDVKRSGNPKQINLANEVLKFINKFEL